MKKRESIIMLVVLVVMIIAIVGVSYAAFNYSRTGEKLNSITTGSITMSYEESDNVINLTGSLPTVDEAGKKRLKEGEYFDFTISSNIVGNININYEISAKDVTTSDRKIDGSNIKLYLTRLTENGEEELMTPEVYNEETSENTYTGRPSGEMSLYTSSMNSSESNNYRLRMWVDENYNPQGDGGNLQFSVQINVYGKSGDKMPNKTGPISDIVLDQDNLGENASTYDDGEDTFITGEDPNNYIWYSGKLWRAISVNNEEKTTKLVAQWNISTVPYNGSKNTSFEESHVEQWLNDTSVDGFLGNLREPENFIKMDSKWNATMMTTTDKPPETTMVEAAVGLLNVYEYTMSYKGTSSSTGYLNNGISWWTLTPYSTANMYFISSSGSLHGKDSTATSAAAHGTRPSINLKSDIKIVDGDGTVDNPYRLEGDNDTNLSGTSLNTRYSGEYIRFGIGENNLYRIVSHETPGLTKIVSAESLKDSGVFKLLNLGLFYYSSETTMGKFLNGEYLTNYVGEYYSTMVEENTTWYMGTVADGGNYRLAKYTDVNMSSLTTSQTTAKIGLLRFCELMSGQFEVYSNSTSHWTLTPHTPNSAVRYVQEVGRGFYGSYQVPRGIRPALNLKFNVVITSGDGTKNNPFIIELESAS